MQKLPCAVLDIVFKPPKHDVLLFCAVKHPASSCLDSCCALGTRCKAAMEAIAERADTCAVCCGGYICAFKATGEPYLFLCPLHAARRRQFHHQAKKDGTIQDVMAMSKADLERYVQALAAFCNGKPPPSFIARTATNQ